MPKQARRTLLLATAATAAIVASTGIGHADVIDGDWCFSDGRHFSIRGPEIVTPEGVRTTGAYSRHAFSYTTPGGGEAVDLRLLNEYTLHRRHGTDAAAPETWTRCQPVS